MNSIIKEKYRKRNERILKLANKGWPHKSIARMMKIKNHHIVTMVIWRARQRERNARS